MSTNALPEGFTLYTPQQFEGADIRLSARTHEYFYHAFNMQTGTHITAPDWPRVMVFIPGIAKLEVQIGADVILRPGDSYMIAAAGNLQIKCISGSGILLMAGSAAGVAQTAPQLRRAGEYYQVTKPWGHELWLNGEDPVFSFKEVHIKAGNQTSLQYHNFKIETSFLYAGKFELIYNSNNDVTADDLAAMTLEAPVAIHIVPHTLHRLRAITDLYSYEVSTPHLDDVIRVQDDASRPHGRIANEHQKRQII